MIKIVVMVQDGCRAETIALDLEKLDPYELALVADMAHELCAKVERIAAARSAKARRAESR